MYTIPGVYFIFTFTSRGGEVSCPLILFPLPFAIVPVEYLHLCLHIFPQLNLHHSPFLYPFPDCPLHLYHIYSTADNVIIYLNCIHNSHFRRQYFSKLKTVPIARNTCEKGRKCAHVWRVRTIPHFVFVRFTGKVIFMRAHTHTHTSHSKVRRLNRRRNSQREHTSSVYRVIFVVARSPRETTAAAAISIEPSF